VLLVVPPAPARRWNAMPLAADASMNACCESAVSDARIITPAFTHAFTSCGIVATRATMVASPARGVYAKWNASAVPQMSAPEPLTV